MPYYRDFYDTFHHADILKIYKIYLKNLSFTDYQETDTELNIVSIDSIKGMSVKSKGTYLTQINHHLRHENKAYNCCQRLHAKLITYTITYLPDFKKYKDFPGRFFKQIGASKDFFGAEGAMIKSEDLSRQ